ncbi:MAG: 30S ribosomal protein S20 [Candidatus Izemoplasmatales bacterium]
MANIKSSKKSILTSEKKRQANSAFKTSLKTAMKNVELAVAKGDKEAAASALALAYKKLDKSVAKNIHKANFASREKSRLSVKVNTLN